MCCWAAAIIYKITSIARYLVDLLNQYFICVFVGLCTMVSLDLKSALLLVIAVVIALVLGYFVFWLLQLVVFLAIVYVVYTFLKGVF